MDMIRIVAADLKKENDNAGCRLEGVVALPYFSLELLLRDDKTTTSSVTKAVEHPQPRLERSECCYYCHSFYLYLH